MKKILPYILLIIVSSICLHLYNDRNNEIKRNSDNIRAYNDSIKHFQNKNGEIVSSKLAVQLTNKELKQQIKGLSEDDKRLKEAIKKYKKVIATVQTTQDVKIDTIFIPFKDTIPYVFSKEIEVIDTYYRFDVKLSNTSFKITNFSLTPNKQDIVIGWKKKGLFKNPLATIEITNSNKLFNQTEIKPIIIVYKKQWHEKWYITLPSAFLLGKLF
mgnify:FL=1